jgi:uncharacterized protein YaaN involved in tellurite resistance
MRKVKAKSASAAERSTAEKKKIASLAASIDIANTDAVLQFGVTAQRQVSSFCERVLTHVRAKDVQQVRDLVGELVSKIKRLGVSRLREDGFLARVPVLGTRMGAKDRFFTEYAKVNREVERITERLDEERAQLLKDVELFDKLHEQNNELLNGLEVYIRAAELKLQELNAKIVPKMKKGLDPESNPMDAHRLSDFLQQVKRLERKLDDLKLGRKISVQSAGQIRLVQSGLQVLIEGIQSATLNSVPLWRSQIATALARARQKKTLKLQSDIAHTTGAMLKRSTEVLRRGGVELGDEHVTSTEPEVAREAEQATALEPRPQAGKTPEEAGPDKLAEGPGKPTGKQPAVPATVSMRAIHDH